MQQAVHSLMFVNKQRTQDGQQVVARPQGSDLLDSHSLSLRILTRCHSCKAAAAMPPPPTTSAAVSALAAAAAAADEGTVVSLRPFSELMLLAAAIDDWRRVDASALAAMARGSTWHGDDGAPRDRLRGLDPPMLHWSMANLVASAAQELSSETGASADNGRREQAAASSKHLGQARDVVRGGRG